MTRAHPHIFRQVPLGWRLLSESPTRFLLTVAGIGGVVALMLFLAGVYDGVRTESNAYVSGRPVDVWIAQTNSTNLIRSSSYFAEPRAEIFAGVEGVESVTPLLKLITTLSAGSRAFTVFVCGIDGAAPATRPAVIAGSGTPQPGEIVIDRALARRARVALGDRVDVQGRSYRVSGISTGTNVIMTQFTFVDLKDARELLGFDGVVSFLLVRGRPGMDPHLLAQRLRGRTPAQNVLTAEEFTRNNLDELRAGLLPILATILIFGALVAMALLTLLMYGAVVERKQTYALLKAIGASAWFLQTLVLRQVLALVVCGLGFGGIGYALVRPFITWAVPVMALSTSMWAVALVTAASLLVAAGGAWIPLRRLAAIHPAEVFRV